MILGGDGTFSEVVNGLMKKTQLDAGIDINDPNSQWAEFPKPIAIVPTGNTFCSDKYNVSLKVTFIAKMKLRISVFVSQRVVRGLIDIVVVLPSSKSWALMLTRAGSFRVAPVYVYGAKSLWVDGGL